MSLARSLTHLSRRMSSAVTNLSAGASFHRNLTTTAIRSTAVVTGAPGEPRRLVTSCGFSVPVRHYQATGKRNVNGDKQLLEFLNEEIKEEAKAHPGNLPAIEGFDASSDEATITLTKKLGNEIVTVKFNVNNSIQMDDAYEEEVDQAKQEEQSATTVSVPSFIVEINRGGKYKLAIRCSFSEMDADEEASAGEPEAAEDPFEIEELTLYEKEKTEKTYCVQASFMDGALYDLLAQMLEDRGINQKFADQLVAFSTNYEHGSYIRFLENLREFFKTK